MQGDWLDHVVVRVSKDLLVDQADVKEQTQVIILLHSKSVGRELWRDSRFLKTLQPCGQCRGKNAENGCNITNLSRTAAIKFRKIMVKKWAMLPIG